MIHIKIISVGKTKETWLQSAVDEYTKRLTGTALFTFQWVKNDKQLLSAVEKETSIVCLDPQGKSLDSFGFTDFLFQSVEKYGSKICFVIGGAAGLPETLRQNYPLLSLSKLTFTHQISRLILIEQIYRAFEIFRGKNYQK